MSVNSRDPKGDRRSYRAPVTPNERGYSQASLDIARIDVSVHQAEQELGRALNHFSTYDHGYLKTRRSALGSELHLTWTWTLGIHAGSYVYVRVEFWEFAIGLQSLARKVAEVDLGQRRPSPDKRNPARSSE